MRNEESGMRNMFRKVTVLMRGFFISLTGKPCVVIGEMNAKHAPDAAMKVEICCTESEESIADAVRRTYDIWKKSALRGAHQKGRIPLPSCIAFCLNDKVKALFWRGDDLDSVRKRIAEKDASPVTETIAVSGAKDQIDPSDLIDPMERVAVLKNKITLVTGGAQGIGEEIARNLAVAGALVFISDLNLKGAEDLAKKINTEQGRTAAIALKVDVTDEASVEAMFNTVAETAGGLDLCVSNAGVLKAGSVLDQELAEFKFVTDINYTGFFIVSKFAGRLLRIQHLTAPNWKTDIVQINSKSGLEGSNKNGAYSGSKFGGLGLVASFARELIEYNIKVNAICPGNLLDSPLWSDPEKGLFVQYLKAGKVPGAKRIADVRSFYETKVPMRRGCTGKDVMRALYYIVEQEYETGQAVPVTGGQVMLH